MLPSEVEVPSPNYFCNSDTYIMKLGHREKRKDSKNLVRKSEVVKEGMPQTDQLIDKPSANLTQDPGENRNPLLK